MSGGKPWGGPYSPKRPSGPSRPSRPERASGGRAPTQERSDRLPPTESLPVYGQAREEKRGAPDARRESPFERPSASASRDDWRTRLSSPSAKVYDAAERQRRAAGRRARRIPWFGLPFLFAAFGGLVNGAPGLMIANLGAWALMALGAHLIGEGQKAQEAYDARAIAAPPSLPRKLLGALAVGLGVGIGGSLAFGLLMGGAVGLVAAALSVFAFGLDPMKAKGDPGADVTVSDLDAALNEARGRVAALEGVARNLKDRSLGTAIREITDQTNMILTRIEQDPNDLRRSRKFLKVYLDGVLEAARKYERAQVNVSPDTEWSFRKLLRDMRQVAAEHYDKLLHDDRTDLEVEIEVLADRLKHEAGI